MEGPVVDGDPTGVVSEGGGDVDEAAGDVSGGDLEILDT